MALKIIAELCTACADCEPICPTNSIVPFKGLFKIEEDKCTECEGEFDDPQCLEVCMEDGCIIPA